MNPKDSLLDIFRILYKWRKSIISTCLIAAIGTAIISLTLDNYYKSTTVFYPASPDLAKPTPVGPMDKDIDYYGEPEDLDRLLSIASSNEVADFMIHKFNLYDHYDIDRDSKKGPYKIKRKFFKLYQAQKTKYDAVQLSMEDKDPVLAAEIANEAREKINRMAQKLIKQSQSKLLNAYEANIANKDKELKLLNDSLYRERKRYGIYDSKSQGEILAELQAKAASRLNNYKAKLGQFETKGGRFRDSVTYLRVAISGLEEQNRTLIEQLQKFNEGLAQVMTLESEQEEFAEQMSLDKERYKQLQSTYNTDFSGLHVVEQAEVPIVKSRPRRSIYVIMAGMIAFLFSVMGVLLIESYRTINWKQVFHDK